MPLKKNGPPTTLYSAIVLIAKLGGYINRRNDPPPGYEAFWRGYQRLQDMFKSVLRDRLKQAAKRISPPTQKVA